MVAVELLADLEPSMTEGIVIVTFLIGTFSCFGGAWLLIWEGVAIVL